MISRWRILSAIFHWGWAWPYPCAASSTWWSLLLWSVWCPIARLILTPLFLLRLGNTGCSGQSKFQIPFQLKCWNNPAEMEIICIVCLVYVSHWTIFTPLKCRYVVSSGAVLALVASLIGGILPQVCVSELRTQALLSSLLISVVSYFLWGMICDMRYVT